MRAIILAAGSGNRMKPLTQERPKCLLTINGETLLSRLARQMASVGCDDIIVVVGYKREAVIQEIECQPRGGPSLRIVENPRYMEDVNILSLTLALRGRVGPFWLVEGDCVFEDACLPLIFSEQWRGRSVWFSCGPFVEGLSGGILLADERGDVTDVRIVDRYDAAYAGYRKMIGILKVGPDEAARYARYLFAACAEDTKQYYHMPWIRHLDELPAKLCDLEGFKVASFNTVEQYRAAEELFQNAS